MFSCVCSLAAQRANLDTNAPYIASIYNLDRVGFKAIEKDELLPSYRVLLEAYQLFWLAISEDESSFMDEAEKLIDKVDLSVVEDPTLRVSLALLKMRIALINKSYLSAVQTQQIIRRYFAMEEMTMTPYDRFLHGMYHYFVSYGRQSGIFYRLYLVSWPQANAEKGLAYLLESAKSSFTMISTEARYFLGRIYLEYEGKEALALPYFEYLHSHYPQNPIYADFLQKCRTALGQV